MTASAVPTSPTPSGIPSGTPANTTAAATAADAQLIRSSRFRAERETAWTRLEELVNQAEKGSFARLGYEQAQELTGLYSQAVNALSLARAISMDQALEAYLQALCARAYLVVYAPQESLRGLLTRFVTRRVPRAVQAARLGLALGFLTMLLGAVIGYILVAQDSSWFFSFVPGGLADGRVPGASTEFLRSTLFDSSRNDGEGLGVFATFLFSHNTSIAISVFALGVLAGVPSVVLTFVNGLMLGAFVQIFAAAGLGVEVAGWLSIHGVTEISAIAVACAGGIHLGRAVVDPGRLSRRAALAASGRDAVTLIVVAGLMLIVAALVEGFLRQLVQDTALRLAIGWGLGLMWLVWFLWPVPPEDAGQGEQGRLGRAPDGRHGQDDAENASAENAFAENASAKSTSAESRPATYGPRSAGGPV